VRTARRLASQRIDWIADPTLRYCHEPRAGARARRHWYQGLPRPEHFLSATEVRQMAGRAGRTGLDEYGEAIMIAPAGNPRVEEHIFRVMQARACAGSPRGPQVPPRPAGAGEPGRLHAGPSRLLFSGSFYNIEYTFFNKHITGGTLNFESG